MTTKKIAVCPIDDLPRGGVRRVSAGAELTVAVFNCGDACYAIEDRCSHDNAPIATGALDPRACTVACPRHGSVFGLKTGIPKTLPAFSPIRTFPVSVEDGVVVVEVTTDG